MESLTGERSFSAEFKIDDLVKRRNSIEFVWRNPSVTGGYSLWTKVRRKGKGPPWPGGPVPPRRDWNHEALVFSWTGRGPRPPRLLWRKLSPFPGAMGLPADASGAYRPNPQATAKLAPRPSSRKGYIPAKAGIQLFRDVLDPGFRRGDAPKAAGAMVSIVGASCGRP
jgi:hypothetical protein